MRTILNILILPLVLVATGTITGCTVAGTAVGLGSSAGVAASEERGFGGSVDDTTLRTEINFAWLEHDFDVFRQVELNISEGRVLLTGVVKKPEHQDKAVQLVWKVKGVREVYNEIKVNPEGTDLSTSANDIWVSQKLKGTLLLDKKVRHINYSWSVVDDTIYLIGLAQDETEMRRVVAHARDMPAIKAVNSYIRLKDDPSRKVAAK